MFLIRVLKKVCFVWKMIRTYHIPIEKGSFRSKRSSNMIIKLSQRNRSTLFWFVLNWCHRRYSCGIFGRRWGRGPGGSRGALVLLTCFRFAYSASASWGPETSVCRLVAPGLPFRWGAGGLGSWGGTRNNGPRGWIFEKSPVRPCYLNIQWCHFCIWCCWFLLYEFSIM